ncbi:hypothetical protein [Streptomyces olivaceus]|uniref:hypothetical protein n=1 Tax=Streptomyces olivaceus TaxID=47716 RepID=UPI003659E37B
MPGRTPPAGSGRARSTKVGAEPAAGVRRSSGTAGDGNAGSPSRTASRERRTCVGLSHPAAARSGTGASSGTGVAAGTVGSSSAGVGTGSAARWLAPSGSTLSGTE